MKDSFFRFSAWLPAKVYEPGTGWTVIDCDLAPWVLHFARHGIRCEIGANDNGQVALFREGTDAFPDSEQD